jgi:hypothetical protein
VQARNHVGYSLFSTPVSILVAEEPAQPLAPVTSISESYVAISWEWPNNRGSPITAYKVVIRESDDFTFTEDLIDCDGTNADIVLNRQCLVPISSLRTAPYSLSWGSEIFAKVSAINIYGSSLESPVGSGAVILTKPDAPLNLQNVPLETTGK